MPVRKLFLILMGLCCVLSSSAQQKRFFNLTASEIKVDSVLPQFVYSVPLPENYADSVYSVRISYPEFVDLAPADIAAYKRISGAPLPELPIIEKQLSLNKKKCTFVTSFLPIVYRDHKYQALVSFMLTIEAKAMKSTVNRAKAVLRESTRSSRYATKSVLSSGSWAKIRVSSDGVYQITDALIRKAGFSDLSKIKVYGYGGHLQNETLADSDLVKFDDLSEVPQCVIGSKHLFYAKGPVSWSSNSATLRTRNPYSDYGYYFITQSDGAPGAVDSASFLSSFYPSATDYHSLREVDGYSWYEGGRNLFDSESIAVGSSKSIVLSNPGNATSGTLTVRVSAGSASSVSVSEKGSTLGSFSISLGTYDKGNMCTESYSLSSTSTTDTIKITPTSGGPIRLDFVSVVWNRPASAPDLTTINKTTEYVYNITNQNHHADTAVDMVIIIPTSQKLLSAAQTLAAFHESHDSLRVRIVPADELYNEFSSGTPDANAYRRYMKMLYDRAETESDQPKYLLLFGDGVWDNRMLTSDCKSLDPDDYLLCYESENSFNEVNCYVDDSWYGLLDDGEGSSPTTQQIDVAVGRFPVTTLSEATVMVNKTISYANNKNAGSWQNTLMFMGA